MALSTSSRSKNILHSEIRNMSIECDKRGGINLSQGVCDLATPGIVADGAIQAIRSGINHYTRYDGLPELRKAISDKLKRHNNITADPDSEIVVSSGATGAFYSACIALLDPGDEVLVFEPYYGYHINTLLAVGAVPVYVKLSAPDWSFSVSQLTSSVTAKTRGILVNTPANPTGKVFTADELAVINSIAIKNDLFIFTDEIYEYFVYDGAKHISPGSSSDVKDRTITISGHSKTFSITGWRIGYAVCDAKWAETIGYVNDLVYVCAPAPLQLGVAAGLDNMDDSFYEDLCGQYLAKRDILSEALRYAGLEPSVPRGAYYIMANTAKLPGTTGKDKALYILEKTGVACVPGSAFWHDGQGEEHARFCFAKSDKEISEACKRLRRLR